MNWNELSKAALKNNNKLIFSSRSWMNWQSLISFRKHITDEDIIESKFDTEYNCPRIPDFWKESTYSDYIQWEFNIETNILNVQFYHDNNYGIYSDKYKRYCHWNIQCSYSQHKEIYDTFFKDYLYNSMQHLAEIKYERLQEEQKQKEINNIFISFFSE